MPSDADKIGIIERGAAQPAVVEEKAAGLDQVDLDPKAGGKPQQGAGILRNIRLEQGEAQAPSNGGVPAERGRAL